MLCDVDQELFLFKLHMNQDISLEDICNITYDNYPVFKEFATKMPK